MTEETTSPEDFLGLRAKREALGLTLKDVFALTRVSVVNLEAIETGNFSALPVPLYAKNFIKTYARVLAVDSKPILDSYETYVSLLKTPAPQVPENAPEKGQPIGEISHRKTYIIAAVIIIVVAVAAVVVFHQYQQGAEVTSGQPAAPAAAPQTQANIEANPQEAPKEAGEPVAAAADNPAQPAMPAQQKSPAQLKSAAKQQAPAVEKIKPVVVDAETESLVIKAVEDTWLRITIDRNPPFEVLLKPGETIERKGVDFEMDIGNAGGIKMQFKGKVIEGLGKSGQVIHLRLP